MLWFWMLTVHELIMVMSMKEDESWINQNHMFLDVLLGGCTPSYILHTRAFWDLFIGVLFTLEKGL